MLAGCGGKDSRNTTGAEALFELYPRLTNEHRQLLLFNA